MPKISQEEYEILKELDDKWKWIARDKDTKYIVDIYQEKPHKLSEVWFWDGHTTIDIIPADNLFQFIKWEDEEPHNIAELIREYEWAQLNEKYPPVRESEETEVKNIEWLKEEITEILLTSKKDGTNYFYYRDLKEKIYNAIDQLDEPEILSQEWISENVEYAYFDMLDGSGRLSSATAIIKPKKLQNLLVPKQADIFNNAEPDEGEVYFAVGVDGAVEINSARSVDEAIETLTDYKTKYIVIEKPVIPKFVADYINKQKEFGYSFLLAYEVISDSNKRHEADEKLVDYIQKNQDDFVRAWYGYEIEPEPQYRLKAGENYLYFNLDGTVRGSTKKNAAITKKRLEELPFDVEMAVLSGIIEVEELEE